MGQAIGYCLGYRAALAQYVKDGDLAIGNHAAENALRSNVLGHKNWLRAGRDKGGGPGAVPASLTASCKRLGVDPFAYLEGVLTRIGARPGSRLDEFLPNRWKTAPVALIAEPSASRHASTAQTGFPGRLQWIVICDRS